MFIAMNRFKVKNEFSADFEKLWKERESHLHTIPGFIRFYLLKAKSDIEGVREYISHSLWFQESSFESWMKSSANRRSHESARSIPREAYAGPPQFTAYDVIDQDHPNHRTDFRSPTLDWNVENIFAQETEAQKNLQKKNKEQNLPSISVGAMEGRILEILLRSVNAKRGVEIGTLGAYSTSWLARGLAPDGKIISIEKDPKRAELARENLKSLGLENRVEVLEGAALDVLSKLSDEKNLDFVFIDADKSNYGKYVEWAIPRLRKGGILLADNAYIWGGMNFYPQNPEEVAYPEKDHPGAFSRNEFAGMSECWKQMAEHPDLASLILPTGEGLGIAVKK